MGSQCILALKNSIPELLLPDWRLVESDLVYMYIYSKLDILDFYIFLVLDQPSLIPVFCVLFLSCLGGKMVNVSFFCFFVSTIFHGGI